MENYNLLEMNETAKEILTEELFEEQFFYLEAMKEWEEKHDLVYK